MDPARVSESGSRVQGHYGAKWPGGDGRDDLDGGPGRDTGSGGKGNDKPLVSIERRN